MKLVNCLGIGALSLVTSIAVASTCWVVITDVCLLPLDHCVQHPAIGKSTRIFAPTIEESWCEERTKGSYKNCVTGEISCFQFVEGFRHDNLDCSGDPEFSYYAGLITGPGTAANPSNPGCP